MTAPLKRVRHPRHVYVIGFLFSLGFDTSSQIGVLILTAGAALAGASAISLLCLPILFTAAMTLGRHQQRTDDAQDVRRRHGEPQPQDQLQPARHRCRHRLRPDRRRHRRCPPCSPNRPGWTPASSTPSPPSTPSTPATSWRHSSRVIGISAWMLWRRTSRARTEESRGVHQAAGAEELGRPVGDDVGPATLGAALLQHGGERLVERSRPSAAGAVSRPFIGPPRRRRTGCRRGRRR